MRIRSRLPFPLLLPVVLALTSCKGRDALLADLQSPRPEERAHAVEKLSSHGRSEDLVLFTQAAKDVAAMVRAEAAEALGKSQDPRVVDLLGELLEDPDESVQARAAMALAEVKDGKSKGYLTQQYARRGRSTRLAILQALKHANVPGGMTGVVSAESKALWESHLRALEDGTLAEQVGAAEALGRSGRPDAATRLLPLIRDSQVVLAAAAVRGLGEVGDKTAAAPITALLDESFPELREAASTALVRLKEASALPALLRLALERTPSSLLATNAVLALPRTKETDEALCTIMLDGARKEALAAGREMRTRGACPLDKVVDRLGSPKDVLSGLHAVQALGPVAKSALPRVLPFLESQDPGVRLAALEAVAEVADPSAGRAVRAVVDTELAGLRGLRTDWVKRDPKGGVAPTSAGQSPPVRVPAEIVDDLSAEQLRLPAAALRALGAVRADGAFALLTPFAEDPHPVLRTAARLGLASLGDAGRALAAQGLLEGDSAARGAVALALAEQGTAGQKLVLEALGHASEERTPLLAAVLTTGAPKDLAPALEPLVGLDGLEAAMAAQLLGQMGASDSAEVLLRALESPTTGARSELLRALGLLGDEDAAEVIANDLCHDLPDVRAAAAEALGRVGTSEQLESLTALKGDYYRRVREASEAALAQIQARESPPQGAR
ncbi:MAG: HEAT repeat domain-containing protein [Myxococcaceae bacterium]|nr:HEAT repeat domain-containing protein [Myxococcaceae bacterium]MCI0669066.1 HEAT repeat domain-containing protein [Myxococcaceae bacterium]